MCKSKQYFYCLSINYGFTKINIGKYANSRTPGESPEIAKRTSVTANNNYLGNKGRTASVTKSNKKVIRTKMKKR